MRSAIASSKARLDIKAGGSGQEELRHFLISELRTSTPSVTRTRQYWKCSRARRREEAQVPAASVRCRNGLCSFTSLVFGTNGRMGNECQLFLKHLAYKIAEKDTEPYHIVIAWLRTQISFELLRLVHACVRGSRMPFRSMIEQSLDCKINATSADIRNIRFIFFYAFILRAFYRFWLVVWVDYRCVGALQMQKTGKWSDTSARAILDIVF